MVAAPAAESHFRTSHLMTDLKGRSLLTLGELTTAEITYLLDQACRVSLGGQPVIFDYRPVIGFLDDIIIGQDIQSGDAVIGIESSGIHSNGLSLARHVFFEKRAFSIEHIFPGLSHSLGKELLKPTYIYVKEILDILKQNISVKALIHITSDGFLNLTRVKSKASYVIEQLPPRLAIFSLIQELGQIEPEEMFSVYNMWIGFCIVVPEREIERVISIIKSHQKNAHRIGYAIADGQAQVDIRPAKLMGKGKKFTKIDQQ
jgi:phosphoribosylformylglycinamidine cyclo-ligase